jgi:hypothetical protein
MGARTSTTGVSEGRAGKEIRDKGGINEKARGKDKGRDRARVS